MFNKKLVLFLFIFINFHNSNVYSVENRDNEQIVAQVKYYNAYIKEILSQLQSTFNFLEDSKNCEDILQLLVQIRLKELEYPNKYQFVTAQDSRYFAYQVIAKELYEAINGEYFSNFEFLRYPSNILIKNPEEFFYKYPLLKNRSNAIEINPYYFDALPEISYQLLSASFSIDTYVPADSALFVFLYGKGISEWFNTKEEHLYHEKFIQNVSALFDSTGIDNEIYQPYLNELLDAAPKTKEGIINQIFLPIENIEDYLYISSSGGFLNTEKHTDIHQTIATFQKVRFTNFKLKENMQVRLIIGSLFNKNVNIYRYTLIPKNEQESYKELVKKVIQQMLN